MTNEKKKLIAEVDELQGFINTCEVALDYSLGLDERLMTSTTEPLKDRENSVSSSKEWMTVSVVFTPPHSS